MNALRRAPLGAGPWISVVVALCGVAAGLYMGMVTPPLSGGTLAALGHVAVFGAIAVRVIHVRNRKQGVTSW